MTWEEDTIFEKDKTHIKQKTHYIDIVTTLLTKKALIIACENQKYLDSHQFILKISLGAEK